MRYLIAIITTILFIGIPLILFPLFDQWDHTILSTPKDESSMAAVFIPGGLTFGLFILAILCWVSAINDKDIKDIL